MTEDKAGGEKKERREVAASKGDLEIYEGGRNGDVFISTLFLLVELVPRGYDKVAARKKGRKSRMSSSLRLFRVCLQESKKKKEKKKGGGGATTTQITKKNRPHCG